MTSPLLDSTFDALTWFVLRSQSTTYKCSQKKLHALLYFSQSYYGVLTGGDKLLPSVFIASAKGVFEPNILKACKYFDRPPTIHEMPESAVMILESVWRKYEETEESEIINIIKNEQPYLNAMKNGDKSEISFNEMISFYKSKNKVHYHKEATVKIGKNDSDSIMKNEHGKAVKVKSWQPKRI